MTRLLRTLPLLTAVAALMAGCSPDSAPSPDAAPTKKVVSSCYAVSGEEASAILGTTVQANRMAGDAAPISICAYKDTKNVTVALLKIDKNTDKYPDQAKALADDQASEKNLFSSNIKQPKYHAAEGFMAGSFYGDITPRFDSLEVELGTFENGIKILVVINNPKDFETGEKQAADIAHKVFENIQNGKAYVTL